MINPMISDEAVFAIGIVFPSARVTPVEPTGAYNQRPFTSQNFFIPG
jgi:hypothetical protein